MSSLLPRFVVVLAVLLTLVGCSANDEPGALLAAALDASVNEANTPPPRSVSAGTDDAAKASVMAAYVAMEQAVGKTDARYHLARNGDVLGGHNFAQGFDATFDARGFEVKHGQDGWHARIETRAIRCGTVRIEVGAGQVRSVAGEPHRVSIARAVKNDAFEEWAVNGPLGVEQGFTFPGDPCAGNASRMTIEVGVDGMVPVANGNAVALQDDKGKGATVSGLSARDATGRVLTAHLVAAPGAVEIVVDTSDARWPVVVDPVYSNIVPELGKDDGASGDQFGASVALGGSIALVGAPFKSVGG